jgi:hypothetical protein
MNSKTTKFAAPNDVIRSPLRNAPRPAMSFEPEHQRLGITPIQRGNTKFDEPTFSGLDGEIYDENSDTPLRIDRDRHMVDNNDYLFSFNETPIVDTITTQNTKATDTISSAPQVGDYILMVNGKLLSSGTMSNIEKLVKSILYKEYEEFKDQDINIDDIVVLKRVEIKVGVFVGD